jgi:hypothetical protein
MIEAVTWGDAMSIKKDANKKWNREYEKFASPD